MLVLGASPGLARPEKAPFHLGGWAGLPGPPLLRINGLRIVPRPPPLEPMPVQASAFTDQADSAAAESVCTRTLPKSWPKRDSKTDWV
jgi:hypothetical protein